MNIPVPKMGYWQKVRHGYKVNIAILPEDYSGDNSVTLTAQGLGLCKNSRNAELRKLIIKIDTNHKISLNIPSKLTNLDNLIVQVRERIKSKLKNCSLDNGLLRPEPNYLNILVAPKNISRALRLFNGLIKLLKARGHSIAVDHFSTYIFIHGEKFEITLQEKLRIEETIDKYNWRSRKYYPTGILTFRMWKTFRFQQKIWSDGKQLIETQLSKIIAGIELEALKEKEKRKELEKSWREQAERRRIEKEMQERREKEIHNFKDLFNQATRLHQANIMRNYVKTVEEYSIQDNGASDVLKVWIKWANKKIDWFDPLINRKDQFLDDFDKTKVSSELTNNSYYHSR